MLENFQWSPTRPDSTFACQAPSSWPLPRAGFPMLAPSTGWQHIALMHSFPTSELVCCSMSSSNYCFLICMQVSQEAGKVVWYSHFIKNIPQFVVIHTVKGFNIVNEPEVDFLKFSCFFYDPVYVGNLISGSSAFSKSSLYFWKFSVHVLLKPSSKDFEH